jgi:hypothetical protein
VIGNPGQHVGEPGLRIDVVELGSLDQREQHGSAFAAAIGTGEQPCLAAEGNYPSILPISGRMLKCFIAGMRCTDAVFD